MKKFNFLIVAGIILGGLLSACSDIKKPNLHYALTHPWDTKPPLSVGLSKEAVKAKWGEPDITNKLPASQWGTEKEEWIYWGRYPNVPIDYMYLSRTKHLIFEGNTLVDFFDAEEVKK